MSTDIERAVYEAAVVAHGALFTIGKEPRPDRPALEAIWAAVDAALAAAPEAPPSAHEIASRDKSGV
jgi:hypothetical protein